MIQERVLYASTIENFMDKLEDLMQEYDFPPQLIFNFDETMLDPGHPHVKVISHAKYPHFFVETAAKKEHISFGFTTSASGQFLQLMYILPLIYLSLLSQEVINFFAISEQETSFITKKLFLKHVKNVLILAVKRIWQSLDNPKQWTLYLVDSHSSRDFVEAIKKCEDNYILVLYYPVHTSTILQLLDLTINKTLKYALQDNFEPLSNESKLDKHSRLLFISVFCL